MSAYLHLTDVRISKFKTNPQVKFTEDKNDSGRGTLRFKVSNKRRRREDDGNWVDAYDNYTVEYRCKGDSKQIPLLDTPGIRVALRGELLHEEFNGTKYSKLRADNVQVVRTPDGAGQAATAQVASDDVPF